MPKGEHDNILEFASREELVSFLDHDLVLKYKWLPNLKLSDDTKRGREWLRDDTNFNVGPVEWEQVQVNENVAALEPQIVEPT